MIAHDTHFCIPLWIRKCTLSNRFIHHKRLSAANNSFKDDKYFKFIWSEGGIFCVCPSAPRGQARNQQISTRTVLQTSVFSIHLSWPLIKWNPTFSWIINWFSYQQKTKKQTNKTCILQIWRENLYLIVITLTNQPKPKQTKPAYYKYEKCLN
jgi:hypothetical protein